MPYMLLIHEPVGQRLTRSQAEGEAVYRRMLKFADELKSKAVDPSASHGAPPPPLRLPGDLLAHPAPSAQQRG